MRKSLNILLGLLLVAASAPSFAAPTGYAINSDSPTANADSLYRIDLGTGAETRIATVKSLGQTLIDVEGLAFAPDGTLYGVDDDTLTLFPLNPANGVVQSAQSVPIERAPAGLPLGGKNDFGLTFACDGNLYVTSAIKGSLYRLALDGDTTVVGTVGSLSPVKIIGIAAWGNPVRIYGLGNGADENGQPDTPNLYEIDLSTGAAILRGPLGNAAGPYLQGGLAFDDAGQLWAITEGAQFGWPSQVMKVDRTTGTASEVKNLSETGFESLAVTVPRGCDSQGQNDFARFTVQSQYLDGNDETPVTLNIKCNTGLPLEQSATIVPNAGPFGPFEVSFTVEAFDEGTLNCDIWESEPQAYAASYQCFTDGTCSATEAGCSFTGVTSEQENLCTVRNYPNPVDVEVSKEWVERREGLEIDHRAKVDLYCEGMLDGNGEWDGNTMRWTWTFEDGTGPQTATVYPTFDGSTRCRTDELNYSTAVESIGSCEDWTTIPQGAGTVPCQLVNTIFFEGIPTLHPLGLAIAALLLLVTGVIATRRL